VTEYGVTEAVMMRLDHGSDWKVTFAPLDGADGDEIRLRITKGKLDQMSFAAPYTLSEIDELGERDDG
jgi:hypothetical protein